MARPVIALLTDFGTRDHYTGTMKAVVLGICPDVTLIDITHDIPPHDMMTAALQRFPGIGKGEQLRLESASLAGSALVADGRIVHLCAFRSERPSGEDGAGNPVKRGSA